MTTPLTIACSLPPFQRGYGQRRREHARRVQRRPTLAVGRVPRLSRLMALALRMDELVRTGVVADYAELARLGHLSRARISQILNLLNLAPDIQEALLFLPRTQRGRDPVILRDVQPIAAVLDWASQRRLWAKLHHQTASSSI